MQRIQKTLEEANIKLDSVITNIVGRSGRRMIEAMINGVRNPFKLAELAGRRIKASHKALYDALRAIAAASLVERDAAVDAGGKRRCPSGSARRSVEHCEVFRAPAQ